MYPRKKADKKVDKKERRHENGLLEYPQYTRPFEFNGMRVPDVLLSGHHGKVEEWRYQKSLERTKKFRPDMYEAYIKESAKDNEK